VDLGLELGFVVYSAINMAFIFKMNVNSVFIVKILFSNGAEVSEVRWYREPNIAVFWVVVNSLEMVVEVVATVVKTFAISMIIYDISIYSWIEFKCISLLKVRVLFIRIVIMMIRRVFISRRVLGIAGYIIVIMNERPFGRSI